MEEFSRTELLIKKEGIETLQNSTVAIFGVGGVGGFVVEALARAGVGTLHIIVRFLFRILTVKLLRHIKQ